MMPVPAAHFINGAPLVGRGRQRVKRLWLAWDVFGVLSVSFGRHRVCIPHRWVTPVAQRRTRRMNKCAVGALGTPKW